MHQSLLAFRRKRYLWVALLISALALLAYALQQPGEPPNGGTWLGYSLGGIGALLILWLGALGVRKRSYSSNLGSVQGWVSAHVYLGTALLLIVTLHTGFQFGWNVHTAAYVLMCVVILSGMIGVVLYLRYPAQLSSNRAGLTRAQLTEQLLELDERSIKVAARLSAEYGDVLRSNRDRMRIGDGVLALLAGRDRSQLLLPAAAGATLVANPEQRGILDFLSVRISRSTDGVLTQGLAELLSIITARRAVLDRLRRDAQLMAWLEVWLYVHVPCTLALVAALIAHVFSVFFYW